MNRLLLLSDDLQVSLCPPCAEPLVSLTARSGLFDVLALNRPLGVRAHPDLLAPEQPVPEDRMGVRYAGRVSGLTFTLERVTVYSPSVLQAAWAANIRQGWVQREAVTALLDLLAAAYPCGGTPVPLSGGRCVTARSYTPEAEAAGPVLVLEVQDREGGEPSSSGCDLHLALELVDALTDTRACELRDTSTLDQHGEEPCLTFDPAARRLELRLYGSVQPLDLTGEDAQWVARAVMGAVSSPARSLEDWDARRHVRAPSDS